MRYHTAKLFEDNGIGYLKEHYSGRGMYGETTAAYVTDDIFSDIANVIAYASENEIEELIEALENMQQDSMGLQTVYY